MEPILIASIAAIAATHGGVIDPITVRGAACIDLVLVSGIADRDVSRVLAALRAACGWHTATAIHSGMVIVY